MRRTSKQKKQEKKAGLKSNSGQSVVEFALAVPILLLVLVGAVDFGRAFYFNVNINSAAREGVRVASNYTKTDADVRTAVRNEASSLITIADADIVVNPTPLRAPGEPVTVTVSYNFSAITPLVGSFLNSGNARITGLAAAVVQ